MSQHSYLPDLSYDLVLLVAVELADVLRSLLLHLAPRGVS